MTKGNGIVIAFEGVEGSGKSTQAKLFYEKLIKLKLPAILTKEPEGRIREILLSDDNDVFTELFLFLANRRENFLKKVLPAKKDGKIAIIDRSSGSTWAYQFYGKELYEIPYPFSLCDFISNADFLARGGHPIDMNILLDIPIEIGFQRIKKSRKNLTSFEKRGREFHERVRRGFLRQVKEDLEYLKSIGQDNNESLKH